MKRNRAIFTQIKQLFQELVGTGDFIDADMLTCEVKTKMVIQSYDDDLLTDFLEALVMVVRDDDMYNYFGRTGLGILFLELNDWVNKIYREA